ncbi:hypothetical protein AT251_14780 [Enterovibrio nigricans]|nr:hypothetical protein AT251_14780 [Enterovibrio nigricans]
MFQSHNLFSKLTVAFMMVNAVYLLGYVLPKVTHVWGQYPWLIISIVTFGLINALLAFKISKRSYISLGFAIFLYSIQIISFHSESFVLELNFGISKL